MTEEKMNRFANRKMRDMALLLGVIFLFPACSGCWRPSIDADLDRAGTYPKRFEPVVFNAEKLLELAKLPAGQEQAMRIIAQTPGAKVRVIETKGDLKLHYHKHHDEIIFVLRGEGIVEIDEIRDLVSGQPPMVQAGTLIVIPRGRRHKFINTGGTPCTAISIYVPNTEDLDVRYAKEKKLKPEKVEDE